jgi:predicted membrane chloride channel (bestrophin family)
MIWNLKEIFGKAGVGVGLAEMAIDAIAAKINKELEEAVAEARLEKLRDEDRVRSLRALLDEAEIKNLEDERRETDALVVVLKDQARELREMLIAEVTGR